MASVNKVILVGNLGRDPETRYATSGDAITTVSLATTDSWKDKATGEKKEATEWHRVVFFGKLGEISGKYLKKGSQLYVEGRLRTRKWQDKDGQDRYTTEITADSMQMLGGRASASDENAAYEQESPAPRADTPSHSTSAGDAKSANGSRPKPTSNFNDMDDDIPF